MRRIASEILALSESNSQPECDCHSVVIISAYNQALQAALEVVSHISIPIDTKDDSR